MKFNSLGLLFTLVVLPLTLQAQFIDFQSGGTLVNGNSLSGTVTNEGWDQLNTTRISNPNATGGPSAGGSSTRPYGSHNNTAGWYNWVWDGSAYVATTPSTIASNLGSGSSTLWKSSGYGYVGGESIHQGLPSASIIPGGNFEVESLAIADLETLVFQVNATDRAGDVFSAFPTLSFGSTTISADFSSLYLQVYKGISFGEAQYYNYYAFQWDLSDYVFAGGESLSINWTGLTNSGVFGLQLNQGDTFVQVVPEPSTWVMLLAGVGVVAYLKRRRCSN